MGVIRSATNEDREGLDPEVESKMRELIRRNIGQLEKPESEASEFGACNLSSIIQGASGTCVMQIEKVMAELQTRRDHLQKEAQRVQREIAEYADMSLAATKSTKIIAESLAQWKHARQNRHSTRG